MKKVYKGWELLKEIAEGNIKKNTKFNVYRNGELYFTDYVIYNKQNLKINNGLQLIDFLTLQNMLSLDLELIEDQEEINIQDIEEIEELNKSDESKEQSSMKYYNLYKELVDKIKAKIEELDKQEKEVLKGTKGQDRYAIKQEYMHKRSVLQSLLEKE